MFVVVSSPVGVGVSRVVVCDIVSGKSLSYGLCGILWSIALFLCWFSVASSEISQCPEFVL